MFQMAPRPRFLQQATMGTRTIAWHSAIAEVYPVFWSRSFANEDRTGDQYDAFTIAAWLSRTHRDGRLAGFLNPDLSPPERTLAQVEGWILGVPGLIRAGKKREDSSASTACELRMFRLH